MRRNWSTSQACNCLDKTVAMTNRFSSFGRKDIGNGGFSLVELLVVMLIVSVFSLFAGPALVRASRLERNLRDEAYVRTSLVMDLERIAREISLATSIDWFESDGKTAASDSVIRDGRNVVVKLSYPEETGGVSFETNRISQVSSVRLFSGTDSILASASNRVDLAPAERRRHLSADPVFVGGGNASFSGFWITNVVSGGIVQTNLVHVTLSAVVKLDDGNGRTRDKEISVDRLVRMWNL